MVAGLIGWAELAMVLFAIVPNEWKVVAILLNGFPLGMIWGLMVRYLEGRRTSDILLAGLSCSFIIASGVHVESASVFGFPSVSPLRMAVTGRQKP